MTDFVRDHDVVDWLDSFVPLRSVYGEYAREAIEAIDARGRYDEICDQLEIDTVEEAKLLIGEVEEYREIRLLLLNAGLIKDNTSFDQMLAILKMYIPNA